MPSWSDLEHDSPALAARIRRAFDAGTNKTMATLRADGSPRISATELEIGEDVTLGMMGGSRKLADVRRDPRVALHSPTVEPPPGANAGTLSADAWPGDAKLAGVLEEIPAAPDDAYPGAGSFRLDLREAAVTYVGTPADHLVIESWHGPGRYRRRTRR